MGHFDDIVTDERLRLRIVEDHLAAPDLRRLPVRPLPRRGLRWLVRTARGDRLRLGRLGDVLLEPATADDPGDPDRSRDGGRGRRAWPSSRRGAATHVTTQAVADVLHPGQRDAPLPDRAADRRDRRRAQRSAGPPCCWATPRPCTRSPRKPAPAGCGSPRAGSTASPSRCCPRPGTALEEAFGVPVGNYYGMSEAGAVAGPCRSGRALHLAEDLADRRAGRRRRRPGPARRRAATRST